MLHPGRQEDVSEEREYGLGWVLIAGLESGRYCLGNRRLLKVSVLRGYKITDNSGTLFHLPVIAIDTLSA